MASIARKPIEKEAPAAMPQVDKIADARSEAPESSAIDSSTIQEASAREPSHEEIAKLAHSYWLNRPPEAGSAEEDWHRAEKELRNRQSKTVSA